MNEKIEYLLVLIMAFVMLFFGLAFWLIGRDLYGSDASLIFAGGFLVYMAIKGIVNSIEGILKKKNEAGK